LETSNNGILDFVEILDSLCAIHDDIRTCAVGTEAPDFTGFSDILKEKGKLLLVNYSFFQAFFKGAFSKKVQTC
jgi:hypothetical protein